MKLDRNLTTRYRKRNRFRNRFLERDGVRIKDVAQRAGVSAATVSRVLNGVSTVKPDARERVLEAVAEVGYRPNRLASNLRRQKAATLGVVISDIENPHFTAMVRAVEDAAYGRGYRVLLCNTDEQQDKQRAYLEVLADERVHGAIVATSNPAGEELSRLLDLDIPVVAFDRRIADPRAGAVVADNFGGVYQATHHLINLGHQRIGFVGGPASVETGGERLKGYQLAMLEAGLEPTAADGGFRIFGGAEASRLLLEDAGTTALLVANNLMTIGVLEVIRERRIRIPGELAIVAVDDPFWAALTDPPLTTVAQPVKEMADRAVGMLLAGLDEAREVREEAVFDMELRIRGSCGAAKE